MILSKNIINNKKLPEFITEHPVFEQYKKFGKIFSHIGLDNFKTSIKDSHGQIPFVIKNGRFISNLVTLETKIPTWKRILWSLIKKPLYIADTAVDALDFLIYRKVNKDKDLQIVFSADTDEGVWDIATMAMRGISSCQSWHSGRRSHLVGSITDPCCGIIYLTDGDEAEYGTDMLFRSIVRYVVHNELGPCLFLERIYSQLTEDEFTIRTISMLFACMLYRRSGLPVIYNANMDKNISLKEISIPEFNLPCGMQSFASYRDSGLKYKPLTQKFINRFPILGKLITSVYK